MVAPIITYELNRFINFVLTIHQVPITSPSFVPIAPYRDTLLAAKPFVIDANSERIANGHAAANNQFPHQCSVLSPLGGGSFSICGGSIVSASWVLSAAHCTLPHRQFNLRFGTVQLWSGGQTQTSFRAVNHPAFDAATLNNDISLVHVPSALAVHGPAVRPVRLPAGHHHGTTFVNAQAQVSGWGATGPGSGVQQLLRWVHMRIIPNAQCAAVFGSQVVVAHVVCALGWTQPTNQGHCGGDSGGPLTVLEDGVPTQIGVVAFAAAAGCHLGLPSGYVRTSQFVHWVAANAGVPVRW